MPQENRFARPSDPLDLTNPLTRWLGVEPDDANDLPFLPREVRVGTGGTLVASGEDGVVVAFLNVASGEKFGRLKRIYESATVGGSPVTTTASDIVIGD